MTQEHYIASNLGIQNFRSNKIKQNLHVFFFFIITLKSAQLYNYKTLGVSAVAKWLTNLTRSHEVAGSILGLAQQDKDLALL